MTRFPRTRYALFAVLLLAGCQGRDGKDPGSAKFCDAYADVAKEAGCSPELDCSIAAECEDLARAWLTCVRQDLAQCMCESSGKVNCEGSFKPDEGPALCIDAYRAVDACLEREEE